MYIAQRGSFMETGDECIRWLQALHLKWYEGFGLSQKPIEVTWCEDLQYQIPAGGDSLGIRLEMKD